MGQNYLPLVDGVYLPSPQARAHSPQARTPLVVPRRACTRVRPTSPVRTSS